MGLCNRPRNTRKRCEICKLTIKTREKCHWCRSSEKLFYRFTSLSILFWMAFPDSFDQIKLSFTTPMLSRIEKFHWWTRKWRYYTNVAIWRLPIDLYCISCYIDGDTCTTQIHIFRHFMFLLYPKKNSKVPCKYKKSNYLQLVYFILFSRQPCWNYLIHSYDSAYVVCSW